MLADSDIPVVEQTWHVRPDYGGGLVYKFSHDESAHLGLTADEAVAIALCDGNRPLSRIKALLADALELLLGRNRDLEANFPRRTRRTGRS